MGKGVHCKVPKVGSSAIAVTLAQERNGHCKKDMCAIFNLNHSEVGVKRTGTQCTGVPWYTVHTVHSTDS